MSHISVSHKKTRRAIIVECCTLMAIPKKPIIHLYFNAKKYETKPYGGEGSHAQTDILPTCMKTKAWLAFLTT